MVNKALFDQISYSLKDYIGKFVVTVFGRLVLCTGNER